MIFLKLCGYILKALANGNSFVKDTDNFNNNLCAKFNYVILNFKENIFDKKEENWNNQKVRGVAICYLQKHTK